MQFNDGAEFTDAWAGVGCNAWEALDEMYREMGLTNEQTSLRFEKLLQLVKDVCQDQIDAETVERDQLIERVQDRKLEIEHLQSILGEAQSELPRAEPASLVGDLQQLEGMYTALIAERDNRQTMISNLRNQLCHVALEMSEEVPNVSEGSGSGLAPLGLQMIGALTNQISELEARKEARVEAIKALAITCYNLMDFMQIDAQESQQGSEDFIQIDSYARAWGKEKQFNFSLGLATVEVLEERRRSLEAEESRRRKRLQELGLAIGQLWTLLEVPEEERQVFEQSFTSHLSLQTIGVGEVELERLRELKRANMGKVVSRVREQIEQYWDELAYSSAQQREECPVFFVDPAELADDALETHEQCLSGLIQKAEMLRPLLMKVKKRDAIIEERLEIEKLQMNPERLMARGPNASKNRKREEEMTRRVKGLSKLDEEVSKAVESWEETNGPFTYQGIPYMIRIQAQERQYEDYKTALKNAAKEKRKVDPKDSLNRSTGSSPSPMTFNDLPDPLPLEYFLEGLYRDDVKMSADSDGQENIPEQLFGSLSDHAPIHTLTLSQARALRHSKSSSDADEMKRSIFRTSASFSDTTECTHVAGSV